MQSIVWLASYPKSGNTWIRAFLANYLFAKNTPLSINDIRKLGVGDSVPAMYQHFCSDKIDASVIDQYLSVRNKVLQAIVNNKATINFVKTHNANIKVNGQALIPVKHTRGAVYIIRNPLDVVVSFSKQLSLDYEQTSQFICQSDRMLDGNPTTTPQFFSDWSTHVESWTENQTLDHCFLRYEDLIEEPECQFKRLLEWIGLPFDKRTLIKAINFTEFKELKNQEKRYGFDENASTLPFFNTGKPGQWRHTLTKSQIDKIVHCHQGMMTKYNYLP